jgi:mannose-6-phosphate isomerase-like protein (cupin superfamily)
MSGGYVTDSAVVPGTRDADDTAEIRVTIDASHGCERLEQRVIAFGPGRSRPRTNGGRQEVLYVSSGRGTIELEGEPHPLAPETGVYVRPDETYVVANDGPDDLVVVSVTAPEERGSNGLEQRRVTVRYADQPSLPATPNREFRYLVNQEAGCPDVTQFVGVIPPGRAGLHSHTYDEVVYVLEGEGVLHLGGKETELRPGSCIHLPPLVLHSLENTGPTPMRVLGVFHPSGDPASRAVGA